METLQSHQQPEPSAYDMVNGIKKCMKMKFPITKCHVTSTYTTVILIVHACLLHGYFMTDVAIQLTIIASCRTLKDFLNTGLEGACSIR